jgi:hypothetical protein
MAATMTTRRQTCPERRAAAVSRSMLASLSLWAIGLTFGSRLGPMER